MTPKRQEPEPRALAMERTFFPKLTILRLLHQAVQRNHDPNITACDIDLINQLGYVVVDGVRYVVKIVPDGRPLPHSASGA